MERHVLMLTSLLVATGSGSLVAQSACAASANPSDVAEAMQCPAWGFFAFASDGTARSDSASRMAALALWDVEGGDRARGARLLRSARVLGVADSLFYAQAGVGYRLLDCPHDAEAVYGEGLRRWPHFRSLWLGLAATLESLDRAPEAEAARQRADSLEKR